MSYAQSLILLWLLILGIVLVPGMDMLLVLSNALARGWRAGMAAVGGIMTAGAGHTLWGVLSVAVLLRLPPAIFTAMLLAGALYLGWIGLDLMRSAITVAEGDDTALAARSAFRQGAVTAVLNPKAYVFVASVYPQFVRPEFGPLWWQASVILALVATTQFGIYGGVALAAGRIRRWLVTSPGATILAGRATGAIFLAAAGLTLVAGLRR